MKKVVIIEDDFTIASIMQTQINALEGYSCNHVFYNPLDFINNPPECDIVLLDIILPKMNGLDAIDKLLEINPELSIIINSIKDDPDTIFKALQKGAVGYIDKQSFAMNFMEVFQSVENGGAYMTPKIARKVMNFFQNKKQALNKLTEREIEISTAILDGLSYKLIADRFNISIDTVRSHIKNIYKKLKINSKSELFNIFKN
jgi:DNA-binding NarL/FixJ family response regulator